MEPNWEAREAAIAKDLMGGLGWYCDKGGTYDSNPCTSGGTGICKTCEWRKISDPPAYHKDPVAANRVLEKLNENFQIDIHIREVGAADIDVYQQDQKHPYGIPIAYGNADTWMQALVLACTEEGKFCPECHEKVLLECENHKGTWKCTACGNEPLTEDSARVRPELRNAQEL